MDFSLPIPSWVTVPVTLEHVEIRPGYGLPLFFIQRLLHFYKPLTIFQRSDKVDYGSFCSVLGGLLFMLMPFHQWAKFTLCGVQIILNVPLKVNTSVTFINNGWLSWPSVFLSVLQRHFLFRIWGTGGYVCLTCSTYFAWIRSPIALHDMMISDLLHDLYS